MQLPMICVVRADKVSDANLVWAARGLGPETFTIRLCAVEPPPTPETPPTHYAMSAAAAEKSEVDICQAMTDGALPAPEAGKVWGEDGVISAAAAMAATDRSVMYVSSMAGDVAPVVHMAAVLAALGLQIVPSGEI